MKKTILLAVLIATMMTSVATAYEVVDGFALINNSKGYIRAPLVVNEEGYVEFEFMNRLDYFDQFNFVIGYNSSSVRPSVPEYFRTYEVQVTKSRVCGSPYYWNYTLNPKTAYCWSNTNSSPQLLWEQPFNTADAGLDTVYWVEYEQRSEWKRYNGDINRLPGVSFDNMDSWHVISGVTLVKDQLVRVRSYFDHPIVADVKYDLAIYPASYGTTVDEIIRANNNGHLVILDPFINSTDYEVGNLTNASNDWFADRDSTLSNVVLSTHQDVFWLGRTINLSEHLHSLHSFDTEDVLVGVPNKSLDLAGTGLNGSWGGAIIGEQDGLSLLEEAYYFGGGVNNALTFRAAGTNTGWFGAAHDQTISIWVKPLRGDDDAIYYDRGLDGIISIFANVTTTDSLACRVYDNTEGAYDLIETWDLDANYSSQWHHVVLVLDYGVTNGFKCYYNGRLLGSDNVTSAYPSGGTVLTALGRDDANSNNQIMYADQFAVFDDLLNATEVAALYNLGRGCAYDFPCAFDTNKKLYRSDSLSIGVNASSVNLNWTYTSNGFTPTFNFTCDADAGSPTWSGSVSSGVNSCPVSGDYFKYEVLIGGNSTDSLFMNNLTATFLEAAQAPNITVITLSPSTTYSNQDATGSVAAVDDNTGNDTLNIYCSWYVNAALIRTENFTGDSEGVLQTSASFSNTNYVGGDLLEFSCYAQDSGGLNSTEVNASKTIVSAAVNVSVLGSTMRNYNTTNFTSANNVLEFAAAANDLSDGVLFILIIALVFVIAFTSMKTQGSSSAFLASSFLSALLAGVLFVVGLISGQVLLVFFMLFMVGLGTAIFIR